MTTNNHCTPTRANWKSWNEMFEKPAPRSIHASRTAPSQARQACTEVNILEKEDHFLLELAAPGLEKADFKVALNKQILTVSVEKEKEEAASESGFTRREFSYHSFSRSFKLPNTVDGEKIAAEYKSGILNVSLPKREEAKEKPPREIEIG